MNISNEMNEHLMKIDVNFGRSGKKGQAGVKDDGLQNINTCLPVYVYNSISFCFNFSQHLREAVVTNFM